MYPALTQVDGDGTNMFRAVPYDSLASTVVVTRTPISVSSHIIQSTNHEATVSVINRHLVPSVFVFPLKLLKWLRSYENPRPANDLEKIEKVCVCLLFTLNRSSTRRHPAQPSIRADSSILR